MSNSACQYELVDFTEQETALGLTLFGLTSLSILPAILKPIIRKSSKGLSPETVVLTNVQQTLTAANVLVLKFPQIKKCFSSEDPWGCQPPLLVLWQSLSAWVTLFFVFLGCLWYPTPNDEATRRRNKVIWNVMFFNCFAFVGILMVISMYTDCPWLLSKIGVWCGYLSSLFMVFRFAPQLRTTFVQKGSGSMSYTTYVVIGMGGFIMTYFQVVVSQEGVSIWLPVFIGNLFQTVIVFVAAWYDCGPGKATRLALERSQIQGESKTELVMSTRSS